MKKKIVLGLLSTIVACGIGVGVGVLAINLGGEKDKVAQTEGVAAKEDDGETLATILKIRLKKKMI